MRQVEDLYVTVILAAGMGKRLGGEQAKALYPLDDKPIITYVLDAVAAIPVETISTSRGSVSLVPQPIVVVGYKARQVREALEMRGISCAYAHQYEQHGTGHAVRVALPTIDQVVAAHAPSDDRESVLVHVLVCCADTPLLDSPILAKMMTQHLEMGAAITILTAVAPASSDFGRIDRESDDGKVRAIIEYKDMTEAEKDIERVQGTTEVNTAVYCIKLEVLRQALPNLPTNQRSGEQYLTDLVSMAFQQGLVIGTVLGPLDAGIGGNDPEQMAELEQRVIRRKAERE